MDRWSSQMCSDPSNGGLYVNGKYSTGNVGLNAPTLTSVCVRREEKGDKLTSGLMGQL